MLATALILPALALAGRAHAHAYVMSVWKNGEDAWDATTVGKTSSYLRDPKTNSPVQDITATALACNVNGGTEASGWLTAAPGDMLEPEWYHAGERGADPIDPSHKGPIDAYIAPYSSGQVTGDKWVKIAEEAWSSATSDWATDRMIANKGRNTVTLPSTLAPGKYLIRFNLLALHSAQAAPPNGAQWYPSCAQVEITGSGTQELPAGVSIPGAAFTASTPGVVWNIYYSTEYDIHTDYVIPGPAVWDGSAEYPTAQCKIPLDGIASPGFCYNGASSSNSTAPTTAVAAASSAAVTRAASSAAAGVSSAAVVESPAAPEVQSSAAPVVASSPVPAVSSLAPIVATTASAFVAVSEAVTTSSAAAALPTTGASTTTTASSSEVTDYSGCMRMYNACLDEANAAQAAAGGGAVDFSSCANTCSSQFGRRMRRVARGERQVHGDAH